MAGTDSFRANGNIVIPNTNTCGVQTFDMEVKTLDADKSKWARIFHHNNKKGTVLWTRNSDEVLYCTSTDKFSRLALIELYRHPAGHFEFMVLQPDDDAGNTYRWTQTSNPTTDMNVTGYKAVSGYSGYGFGLARFFDSKLNQYPNTFMRMASTWWGAIGAYSNYTSEGITGIPGVNAMVAGSLDLYVRTDNLVDLSSVRVPEKCLYAKDVIEL